MSEFPRTTVENLSLSRMIIGTNWFLGWSHTSAAKDKQIQSTQTVKNVADTIEVFVNAGVDTLMGFAQRDVQYQAVLEAQQRTGKKITVISTPAVPVEDTQESLDEAARTFDKEIERDVAICLPHSSSVDRVIDRLNYRINMADKWCRMIRERGMIPGLSTHSPEAPRIAEQQGLDIATCISIYNAAGFLMPIEVDWVQRMIQDSKYPMMTIKPMAAGRLMPLVGLAFVWATLRDCDMVTVGTMTPDEAKECIDISLAILERQKLTVQLQRTRSKAVMDGNF